MTLQFPFNMNNIIHSGFFGINRTSWKRAFSLFSLILLSVAVSPVLAQLPPVPSDELTYLGLAGNYHVSDLQNKKLAELGYVDVTAPPFSADPTGNNDCTTIIQTAIYFARENQMVLYFPPGTYLVSNTLNCPAGQYPANGRTVARNRYYPCVLLGSSQGAATLILKPNTFTTSANPQPVVNFFSWDTNISDYPANPTAPILQNNVNFNQMFKGINITIGSDNSGAEGISMQAAQGTSIQDVTIDATNGYCGVQGGAGSGGSDFNVTVKGGQVGVYFNAAQPAPTIGNFTLTNQSKNAIYYAGRQALTVVGCNIQFNGTGQAVVAGSSTQNFPQGELSMIDSTITLSNNQTVFGGTSNAYLNNVYIKGSNTLAKWGSTNVSLPGGGSGWVQIQQYAHQQASEPQTFTNGTFTYSSPIYLNGSVQGTDLLTTQTVSAPPSNLLSKHIWGDNFPILNLDDVNSPTFNATYINVKDYGALGDGASDDTTEIQQAINDASQQNKIIFLPKGYYEVLQTLNLPANTQLLGTYLCYSIIQAKTGGKFDNSSAPQPIIQTANDANANTILAFLGLDTAKSVGGYLLNWEAGSQSIFRSVLTNYSMNNNPYLNAPLVLITGNGGGSWYNFNSDTSHNMGPNYRHISVQGTNQPLYFYQCNPEHSRGNSNMDILNSKDVYIYGLKSEGNQPILTIENSDQVAVYGYGGNATALPYPGPLPIPSPNFASLFVISNTPDYLLANLVDSPRTTGGSLTYYAGVGLTPDVWTMLYDYNDINGQSYGTLDTPNAERPVLIEIGLIESPTPTPTPTPTPSTAPTPTPSSAPTSTPSSAPTPTPSSAPTPTLTLTRTPSPTRQPTATPAPTAVPTRTPTPKAVPTEPPQSPSPTPAPQTHTPTPNPRGAHNPWQLRDSPTPTPDLTDATFDLLGVANRNIKMPN